MITQSTVMVAPPASVIVMAAMLAQHGPLAKESLTWKWYWLTEPTYSSQNLPIPPCPRCPLPSGSSIDGPTGSSTRASRGNRPIQSALRSEERRVGEEG